ncbi:DNA-binding transcriptional LysR family regulator [Luteibacter sp. Sphag1AF]|uniref:LysR family transcriptional regulator n=1 Tax=Luteibacter sp. Sphag1AF TaxID=2587031 RepID=UPI001615B5E1|nr:LysR family transcriptional regulator [Luteibacter sp. Sphag1AF]MBB3229120.1 DNA-binding transcriptional LysR family regulator [Luteibacter sp. Sphag1AF]
MAITEPNWDLLRSFLAVMREGSLSGAARALGMTQPSVGRHVRELEASLGVPLFARSPQGLMPTDVARELEPHAQAMASASAALRRAASGRGDNVSGVIRVTASEVVGGEVLPPMLADFRAQYPGVVIELSLSNRTEDLYRRDADIAIRMIRPSQEALVARHVGTVQLGLYAHRRYLDAHGMPVAPEDLADHALIGYDTEQPWMRAMRPAGFPWSRENFALRTDSDLAGLAAMRAGWGIGICHLNIGERDPALVRVLPGLVAIRLDTWITMHEDLRASTRMRLMFDHLAAGLLAYTEAVTPIPLTPAPDLPY